MTCPECGSENVETQIVNEVKLKTVHHSISWWIFIGWLWVPIKWIFLTVPALLFEIFGHKKEKTQ